MTKQQKQGSPDAGADTKTEDKPVAKGPVNILDRDGNVIHVLEPGQGIVMEDGWTVEGEPS